MRPREAVCARCASLKRAMDIEIFSLATTRSLRVAAPSRRTPIVDQWQNTPRAFHHPHRHDAAPGP
jgi:hypothetical protein